jgi:DNA-binding beta-propeller fold protein YncE
MRDVMNIRPRRVAASALAFLVVACAAQVAAPRPSETPVASSRQTASPRPTNLTNDVLQIRSLTNSAASEIVVIDARTGDKMRAYTDAVMSTDRSTLFWTERINGAAQTKLHVSEAATGRELRAFTVEGNLLPATVESGRGVVTNDGKHLVLTNSPYQLADGWVTKIVLVDTSTGAIKTAAELRSASTYAFVAIAPDGGSIFLNQYGEGATSLRVFDVGTASLLPAGALGSAPKRSQNGFRSSGVTSKDGRWLFALDGGDLLAYGATDTPFILAVDLLAKRTQRIALPIEQKSWDFEKYLLWSLVVTADGNTAYAVNPALGVANEIDLQKMSMRRTAQITVSRAEDGALSALSRFLFPVANAKRYVTSGALLSPDERTIYAAGFKGVAAIDRGTLTSLVWAGDHEFDNLAISPDGARLYAADNQASKIAILDTRDGASLGTLATPSYAQAILRVDPR